MKAIRLHLARSARWLGVCLPLLLCGAEVVAAPSLDPHAFEIHDSQLVSVDGVYLLNSDIDFRLSGSARDALESGVPLTFELEIELVRPRRWWLNQEIISLVQRYRVRYHALSQRYVLTNLRTGDSSHLSSRESVLTELGRIRALPIIDSRRLQSDQVYELWLRAGLDVDDLPPPLKTGAYLSPQWRLLSEWHRWRFRA